MIQSNNLEKIREIIGDDQFFVITNYSQKSYLETSLKIRMYINIYFGYLDYLRNVSGSNKHIVDKIAQNGLGENENLQAFLQRAQQIVLNDLRKRIEPLKKLSFTNMPLYLKEAVHIIFQYQGPAFEKLKAAQVLKERLLF